MYVTFLPINMHSYLFEIFEGISILNVRTEFFSVLIFLPIGFSWWHLVLIWTSEISAFICEVHISTMCGQHSTQHNSEYKKKMLTSVMDYQYIYIYRCWRFIVSRAWGVGQTHSYGGPIFDFFCLKDTEKWGGALVFFFSIFQFFKAVGPKWVFQSFLWLDRKYSPIFTFDMSLQRYWTADFRIFKNFEKSWKMSILQKKKDFFKYFFFLFWL